jgi:hypothetical protein
MLYVSRHVPAVRGRAHVGEHRWNCFPHLAFAAPLNFRNELRSQRTSAIVELIEV